MTAYDYFKQQKEQNEKQQFKNDIMMEVEFMVKTAINQVKEEILSAVNREIDVQINALMDGKQISSFNIGDLVMNEVIKGIKSSI